MEERKKFYKRIIMENLPCEITSEILSRVDAGSVLPAKQVCKTWRALLDHIKIGLLIFLIEGMNAPQILYTDFDMLMNSPGSPDLRIDNRNTIFEEFKPPMEGYTFYPHDPLIGSCNGLLCVSLCINKCSRQLDGAPDHIFNPVTGEYVKLPGLNFPAISYDAGGFGYLHTTNEYKVVRIYECVEAGQLASKVEVYTLGSDCEWREPRVKGHISLYKYKLRYPGMLANGALYWLDKEAFRILAFDLRDEQFRILPPPPLSPTPNKCTLLSSLFRTPPFRLRVLRGCLCFVHQKPKDCLDVWLLKKKHNTDSCYSWGMEFSIKREWPYADYDLITLTKSDQVLLWCDSTTVCCYDLKTKILRKLWVRDYFMSSLQVIPHMKSSISLKDLGEKSKIITDL